MADRLSPTQRRRGLRLGLVNATIYSMGYALTTGAIVTYLAIDLGATGRVLSLLLAMPSLAGLLRLFTPAIIAQVGSTKRTCVFVLGLGCRTAGIALGWLAGAADAAGRGVGAADYRRLQLSIVGFHRLCRLLGLVC